jgi:hypothetical protein
VSDQFNLPSYRDLLKTLLARGYEVRDYADAEPKLRHLILRHDIDMSLQAALPIAEIENALGLKAHYFVLLRTEMYNLFSAEAKKILQRLVFLGHEIGLHLDASLYDNNLLALNRAAQEECSVLESAVGAIVRTISFHRPAKELLGYPEPLAGRVHAYQPRFYKQMIYCSDSQGAWRYGHPLEQVVAREGQGFQLLTHPIWWSGDESEDRIARLERFVADRHKLLDRELAANCKPYQAIISERKTL